MSSQWNGVSGNVSAQPSRTVSGATNATPIQITTTVAHGLTNGDRVVISGVQGNVAANGQWYVIVTGASTFTLYAAWSGGTGATPSVGSGAWTSGGTILPYGLLPTIQVLQDGVDALDAAHIHAGLQSVADRTAYLSERTGAYRCASVTRFTIAAAPGAAATAVTTTTNATWVFDSNLDLAWPITRPVVAILPTDFVEIILTGTCNNLAANGVGLAVGYVTLDPGAVFASAGFSRAIGSQSVVGGAGVPSNNTLHVWITAGEIGLSAAKYLYPFLVNYGIGAGSYQLTGDVSMIVKVWRPN